MSQVATAVEGRLHGPRRRDFPPTAPEDWFETRTPVWRSKPCAAGNHVFDVSMEGTADLLDRLKAITVPLTSRDGHRGLAHYRILHRTHEHVPFALYFENTRLVLARSLEPVLRLLAWHVNQSMVASTCRDHVVLHAAAATRAGITVVLPGDQEHGKTTTVAGLLRGGYDYVTDEAVALDPTTLRITSFPKALSIDEGAWPLFPECRGLFGDDARQWQVRAERLGARSLGGTVPPPRLVVFPRYRAGAPTVARPISAGDAVRRLVSCTFRFPDDPSRNLAALAVLAQEASTADLQIGDLDDAVSAIDRMLSEALMRRLSG
jgi:hypothetical protein